MLELDLTILFAGVIAGKCLPIVDAADGRKTLEEVGFLLGEVRRNGEKPELVQEIKRLATRYGIVTPYTSFLVLENDGEYQRWKIERPG